MMKAPLLFNVNGAAVLDGRALQRVPCSLLTNQPDNKVTMAANRSGGVLLATVGEDGPFVCRKLACARTGAAAVKLSIFDNGKYLDLMKSACHVDTILGSGQKPYHLAEALYLLPGEVIRLEVTELSGSANDFYFAAHGYKLLRYDGRAIQQIQHVRRMSTPYWYTLSSGSQAFTGNDAANPIIAIEVEHAFELHQIAYSSTGAFKLDIIDMAKGDSILYAPSAVHYQVPHTVLCGSNNFPFRLHEPVLINPGQKLVIQMTDTSGSANTVYLTLGGRAIWTK